MKAHRTIAPQVLVELGTEPGLFYFYGDAEKRPVEPRVIGPPKVIEGMPFCTMYSDQVRMLGAQAQPGANAFVLGAPMPSVTGIKDAEYSVVVQFCAVTPEEHTRAVALPKREWGVKGMVVQGGRLGWVMMQPKE
jgi:hypothetical protein